MRIIIKERGKILTPQTILFRQNNKITRKPINNNTKDLELIDHYYHEPIKKGIIKI